MGPILLAATRRNSRLVIRTGCALSFLLLNTPLVAGNDGATDPLEPARLEAGGVKIGAIRFEKQDVFDLSDPRENKLLYRLANKWHVMTRDAVIDKQLLLEPGDTYSERLADESERILRRNSYLYDARITPENLRDGTVDLLVSTRDVWTLQPILSVSRKGGENETTIGVEELNVLGRGQLLRMERNDDVDRESTTFEFSDPQLGQNWLSLAVLAADNSDGHVGFLSLARPFFSLDSRWSAGVSMLDSESRGALYALGKEAAEFREKRQRLSAFSGWSAGLDRGWVRRYTAGVVFEESRFSEVPEPMLPPLLPGDRELIYPFIGIEVLQDAFTTAKNREQIERTEDFFVGTRFTASLGWANRGLGSDRSALIYSATYNRGFGSLKKRALLLAASASGREESGNSENAVMRLSARYFRQQSDKRVLFATIAGAHGHDLDLDNPVRLGGGTGLRGYPLRYQNGDASFLLTLEQRYFWDWYPLRLFRVGGAIFADAGRTWGDNPIGGSNQGWLRDIGIGLRFAPTRTGSRKIIHLDVAFPLDGDPSIDDVQVLLESRRSF